MERADRIDRVLLTLLAVSLFVNVAIVWWFVQAGATHLRARATPDVTVGTVLKPIVGVLPDGKPIRVAFDADQRPVVLYVFSSKCEWCRRNLRSISALADTVQSSFRFVGVSISATASGPPDRSLPFPVVLASEQLPFRSTPQTVVVAQDGRVVRCWLGAYVGTTKAEVEEYFATRLPQIDPTNNGG